MTETYEENLVEEAARHKQLAVAFQPVYSLPELKLASFEALIRPDLLKQTVPPSELIEVLESGSLMEPFFEWVLNSACSVAAAACTAVSVNISPGQLNSDDQLAQVVERVLQANQLQPSSLTLEVTERQTLNLTGLGMLRQLKDIGIGIAIDDYGQAEAHWQRLAAMVTIASSLKLDGALIREDEGIGWEVVEASLLMCQSRGINVVAEGVETRQQLERLIALGCDNAQGHYLGRALRHPQVIELVEVS